MSTLVIILFLIVLVFCGHFRKDLFNPFRLFSIYWASQIIICLMLFGNSIAWNYDGLFYILLLSALSTILSLLPSRNKREMKETKFEINHKIKNIILVLLIFLGITYAFILINELGFSVKNFTSMDLLLKMNNGAAVQRYSGDTSSSVLRKILLTFVYAAPMCGGYSYIYSKNRAEKILSILTFLPVLLVLFTENTKATLVACIIFFSISALTAYHIKYNKAPNISAKKIIRLSLLALIVFTMLYFSMMLRIGKFDATTFETVRIKISNYMFGHIPSFDYWFSNAANTLPGSIGTRTFIGIFNLLGTVTRAQGVYTDSYTGGVLSSNVYTYLRGTISDFGSIGGVIFILLLVGVGSIAYKNLKAGSKKIKDQVLTMTTYSFILYFMVSIFSYNSFIFAFVIYAIFLSAIKRRIS